MVYWRGRTERLGSIRPPRLGEAGEIRRPKDRVPKEGRGRTSRVESREPNRECGLLFCRMSLFSGVKDKVIETAALSYLNSTLLEPYGRATHFQLNSQVRTIKLILELKGEAVPVELELTEYEITQEDGRYFAVVKGVRTSREWLTAFARDQLCNRRFELGPKAGPLLMKVL